MLSCVHCQDAFRYVNKGTTCRVKAAGDSAVHALNLIKRKHFVWLLWEGWNWFTSLFNPAINICYFRMFPGGPAGRYGRGTALWFTLHVSLCWGHHTLPRTTPGPGVLTLNCCPCPGLFPGQTQSCWNLVKCGKPGHRGALKLST